MGDKVEHVTAGTCDVLHGPFETRWNTDVYLLGMEDGTAFQATGSEITPPKPAFAVGDKVTSGSAEFALHAGPFNGISGEFWVLEDDNGKHRWSLADYITKVEPSDLVPVGTRVRVDRAEYAERTHGRIGVVVSNTASFRTSGGDRHRYHVELGSDERV
ncbi:hypothetical protein SPW_7345 [Streptomyces sp. W007]|nr:hypothetical protein SPW_7345 [Streptomyces sp. W007]